MASSLASHLFAPLQSIPAPANIRGVMMLTSPSIIHLSDLFHSQNKIQRNPQPPHITLMIKSERRALPDNALATLSEIDTSKIYPLGISSHSGVTFIPVLWAAGNTWRVKHGLPVKDFHITLSAKDEHDIDKSIYSVTAEQVEGSDFVNGVSVPKGLGVEVLDQLYLSSHIRVEEIASQLGWAEYIINSHPESERGYLRLADLAYKNAWWKMAMLSYYAAFTRSPPLDGAAGKRREYYLRKIVSCGGHTEFGPFLTEEELGQISTALSSGQVKDSLLQPWPSTSGLELPEVQPGSAAITRIRYRIPPGPEFPQLPRFFSWLVPFAIAGISSPRSEGDIQHLSSMGITHVITLTSETPLAKSWFNVRIRNTLIPVENYHPPTTQQTDRALRIILEEPFYNPDSPGATLVHCGGGKGRAGTVLACYLALYGFTPPRLISTKDPPKFSAEQAIALLRTLRNGSVETDHQEKFVETYISTAWKRYGRGEPLIGDGGLVPEPSSGNLEIAGDITHPDMILLIGLPGAGKSEFARLSDTLFEPLSMKKFPRTRHLLNLGSATRDDLIIPETDLPGYFSRRVTVEEKIDGANLGFSLSSDLSILVQNRSHYVSASDAAQFAQLDRWLGSRGPALISVLHRDHTLPERFILFGEWVAALHTVHYTTLPDVFLAFDLYDRLEGRFATPGILRTVLAGSGIHAVPILSEGGVLDEVELLGFLDRKSTFGEEVVEGVVVRWDSGERAKVVRSGFVAGRHWTRYGVLIICADEM
ncbi:hypothetical protein C7212DRAFT_365452 [Tuber magnatum]|uniref:Tyrosine specific protein phosphatases domain-containing protein n=1 Tax=Tuber magnatum TaxID=42249 RepID=A0A317SHJ0_9PEZI|nr:hypothetical protein C7212DRAFT_365452 [Tuber magnatum]